jgi:hypothetical protein
VAVCVSSSPVQPESLEKPVVIANPAGKQLPPALRGIAPRDQQQRIADA